MKSLRFFKKGRIQDIGFIVAVVLFLAIIGFFTFKIVNTFNDNIQTLEGVDANTKQVSEDAKTQYPKLIDGAFLVIFIAIFITTIYTSFTIQTSPLFFVISIIVLVAMLGGLALLSNAAEEILENDAFSAERDSFPIIMFFANNLFPTIVIMSATILIALYAKSNRGDEI